MTTPAKSPLQALKRTRKILEDEERWIKGTWAAKTDSGKVCYCLDGALQVAVAGATHSEAYEAMGPHGGTHMLSTSAQDAVYHGARTLLNEVAHVNHPMNFNDIGSTRHADVLRVLDASIEAAS